MSTSRFYKISEINLYFQILPKEEEDSWNSVLNKSKSLEYDSGDEKENFKEERSHSINLSNKSSNDLKTQEEASKLSLKNIKKLHHCHQCQKKFKTVKGLKSHINTHFLEKGRKAESKKHICKVCNKAFPISSKLQPHLNSHFKPFECDICKTRFTTYYTMKLHIIAHTEGGGPYKCPVCAKVYLRSAHLRDHMHTHSKVKPFECQICKKSYLRKKDLMVHMYIHDKEKTLNCDICYKVFTTLSYLKIHRKIHTDGWPHVCETCGKKFPKISYLKIHMNRHTGEKPFECDICKKKFPSRPSMKWHILAHMEEGKPHKCPDCKKCFVKSFTLKEHIRVHSGVKPFVCKVCKKSFKIKGGLTQHMRTHDKNRPFLCDICPKGFKTSGHLKIHKKIHSKDHRIINPDNLSESEVKKPEKEFQTAETLQENATIHSENKSFCQAWVQGETDWPHKCKLVTKECPGVAENIKEESDSILKTEFKTEIFDEDDSLNIISEIEFQDIKIEA